MVGRAGLEQVAGGGAGEARVLALSASLHLLHLKRRAPVNSLVSAFTLHPLFPRLHVASEGLEA